MQENKEIREVQLEQEKVRLKTLVTCKPSEFLIQTNKIRKSAEQWMKATDFMNIRKETPDLKAVALDATDEERQQINAENAKLMKEQSRKNFSKMLDAIMEEHPEETLELLALCCFVDPKDVDDYPVSAYLSAFAEIMNDEDTLSFFSSLVQLAQQII